ncbi:MAG TPA: hypothetical protein ACHBX0_03070 [Arsenophonus sp.]
MVRENLDYSFLFEDIIDFNIKKEDVLIRTSNEALLFELFSGLKEITLPYSFLTFFMSNLLGIVYSSFLAAIPSFLQASISDKEAEYKTYLREGIISVIAEVLGVAITEVFTRATTKAVDHYSKYKFNRKRLHFNENKMAKLIKDFQKDHFNVNITLTPVENENRFLLEI